MTRLRHLPKLFTAHIDAWGTTFIIGAICLILHGRLDVHGLALVAAVTVGYWLGFAFNDYFDAPFDAQDATKGARNFFSAVPLSRRAAQVAFTAIALVLLAIFLSFGARGIDVFILAFGILWAYSAPPLRLKRRPGLDLLTHALFVQTFPYFIPLALLGVEWTKVDVVLLAGFFIASLASQLEQQARDWELDCRTESNFTTTFGRRTTTILLKAATLALMALFVASFLAGVIPAILVPFGVICLPILLHRLIRGEHQPRSEWLFRLTVLVGLGYAGIMLAMRF